MAKQQAKRTTPLREKIAADITNTPAVAATARTKVAVIKEEIVFKRENYYLMLGGAVLIALGMMLMSGGSMPNPNTWDPNIIYSTRILTMAPAAILAGLILEIVAIFKRF